MTRMTLRAIRSDCLIKNVNVGTVTRAAMVASVVAFMASAAPAAEISGAGATFPYPIYAKWAEAYQQKTGNQLNYQSIGSGGGIRQIKSKTVTFGASDKPLKPDELKEAGLVQFPMIMGGVVPVVNVEGIESRQAQARRQDARRHLQGRDRELERRPDRRAQPGRQPARHGDRGRAPLRRLRHHLPVHQLPLQGEPGAGRSRSAPTPRSNGRSASGPRATRASPTTCSGPMARSAMSNTPTRCRTSCPTR